MIEDLEERKTLEQYAKNNGLALINNTTDELIKVCRTHQEQISLKNASVDNYMKDVSEKLFGKVKQKENKRISHDEEYTQFDETKHDETKHDETKHDDSWSDETCSCSRCKLPISKQKGAFSRLMIQSSFPKPQGKATDGWVWQ